MVYKIQALTVCFACSLWQMLMNLPNKGVGRLVQRQKMQRYTEPSALRILEVIPDPKEVTFDRRTLRMLFVSTLKPERWKEAQTGAVGEVNGVDVATTKKRENGNLMHEVCILTQNTSRMRTSIVKQEEEADIRIIVID